MRAEARWTSTNESGEHCLDAGRRTTQRMPPTTPSSTASPDITNQGTNIQLFFCNRNCLNEAFEIENSFLRLLHQKTFSPIGLEF